MTTQRVDGLKYNMDALSEDELENIHGHLLDRHVKLVGDIALVENILFDRRHPQLFDEEPEIHAYGEIADPEMWQHYVDEVVRKMD